MTETENYSINLHSFLTEMQGSIVEKVTFNFDSRPIFDKAALPFNFHYCFSIIFTTDTGNYKLRTAMTSSAIDTFWIEPEERPVSGDVVKPIQSKVMAVSYKNGNGGFAYKMTIEFSDFAFIIFAAEIYDTADGIYDCKINDEMLLVFENAIEAEKFEAAVNYG